MITVTSYEIMAYAAIQIICFFMIYIFQLFLGWHISELEEQIRILNEQQSGHMRIVSVLTQHAHMHQHHSVPVPRTGGRVLATFSDAVTIAHEVSDRATIKTNGPRLGLRDFTNNDRAIRDSYPDSPIIEHIHTAPLTEI